MKKISCAVAMSTALLATPGLAGSLADPVVEVPVIVDDTTGSSSGETMVLLLALLLTAPLWD